MSDTPATPDRPAHPTVEVRDDPEHHRFQAVVDGEPAGHLDYELADGRVALVGTRVLPAFEGRGVGSALVRRALDLVREAGDRTVDPVCPFVASWIDRHPDYRDLVAGR